MKLIYGENGRCAACFEHFSQNWCKIASFFKQDGSFRIMPFCMYPHQRRFLKEMQENELVIGTKFRRSGHTTAVAMWMVWRAFFHGERMLYIAPNSRIIGSFAEYVAGALDGMPSTLSRNYGISYSGFNVQSLDSGGSIVGMPLEAVRGCERVDQAFVDEAAFIEGLSISSLAALRPCANRIAMLSCPGSGNKWFREIYEMSTRGETGFYVSRSHYSEHPDFDEAWALDMRKNLGEKSWRTEVLQEFVS